jgi:hypothetical protein
MGASPRDSRLSARLGSARWWASDRDGNLALAEWPNPALAVWLVAKAIDLSGLLDPEREDTVAGVGNGALVVWSLDELVRGRSPARRALGALVLVPQLLRLLL